MQQGFLKISLTEHRSHGRQSLEARKLKMLILTAKVLDEKEGS